MNKRRLLVLADFLAKLKESDTKEFDMGTFGDAELVPQGNCPLEINPADCGCGEIVQENRFTCKTTACALGWGATIPSFERAGLKQVWQDVLNTDGYSNVSATIHFRDRRAHKTYKTPLTAAKAFFKINEETAHHLFMGDGPHQTAKEAAKEIRRIVKYGSVNNLPEYRDY